MKQVGEVATGYVYYVSLKGVTGAGHLDAEAVARAVPRIKRRVKVPVGVGFGIRDAASAKRWRRCRMPWSSVRRWCNAWRRCRATRSPKAPARFIAGIRSAVDEVRKA